MKQQDIDTLREALEKIRKRTLFGPAFNLGQDVHDLSVVALSVLEGMGRGQHSDGLGVPGAEPPVGLSATSPQPSASGLSASIPHANAE